jgi:hypothetical protein
MLDLPRTKSHNSIETGLMTLGVKLSLAAVAALLLASPSFARADSTYDIAITANGDNIGTVSGSITGTGTSVTSFDITAIDGPNTYVFNSSAGNTGSLAPDTGTTLTFGGSTLNKISLSDGAGDQFDLLVSGDFTSGLTPVEIGVPLFIDGSKCCAAVGANVINPKGIPVVSDDVSLTLQSNIAPTPEPSSLLLMGTGVAGLCATLRRRLRS